MHLAPTENVNANPSIVAQFTAGGGSLAVFNDEGAGGRTARGGKVGGLGGVPKRALQDVTNATQQSSGIVGKKQVRPAAELLQPSHRAAATARVTRLPAGYHHRRRGAAGTNCRATIVADSSSYSAALAGPCSKLPPVTEELFSTGVIFSRPAWRRP